MTGRHGILNIHKPPGPTSHDCVARVRRVMGTRRVGHAGTLDPMAAGVLVVGVGNGTRILEYLQGFPKIYRTTLVLGVETDTEDTTGVVLRESDAASVTQQQVAEALGPFRGPQMQTPPMVSALKVRGRKLYELAREGKTVEREPRPITIYHLELLAFIPGPRAEADIRVECSGGTYIRTLCSDIGRRLGVGGAMGALIREAVGPFSLGEAIPLEELQADSPLVSLSTALAHLPALQVETADGLRLAQGQFIPAPEATPDGPVRVLDPAGELLAVATVRSHREARLLAPEKVFVTADASSHRS